MRFLTLFPLLLLLGACGSPQARPESGPSKVVLKDHRTGTTIGVYNEAFVSKTDYYSQSRSSADFKVIPDAHMGALLEQLKQFDYFSTALPEVSRTPGARTTLIVERNGESWNLAWTVMDQENRIFIAQQCNSAFFAVYNATFSYQIIDNPAGRNIFEEEDLRLKTRRR